MGKHGRKRRARQLAAAEAEVSKLEEHGCDCELDMTQFLTTSSDTLPPTRPFLPRLHKQNPQWGPSIQMPGTMSSTRPPELDSVTGQVDTPVLCILVLSH